MGLSSVQPLLTGLPFFSSGFRTILLRQGELGAKTPLHLTKWDLGGGMMALSFDSAYDISAYFVITMGHYGLYLPMQFK